MKHKARSYTRLQPLFLLLALFNITACIPQVPTFQPALDENGEVSVYLQPLPQQAHRLTFSIEAVNVIRQDGVKFPLRKMLSKIKCVDFLDMQKRLGAAVLPPGIYKGFSLDIGQATLLGEEGEMQLLVSGEVLTVGQEFTVLPGRVNALFLSLEGEKLISAGMSFTPIFSVKKARRQVPNLRGFVTGSHANLVTIFNKKTMRVVDVLATGSGPKGAVLDRRRNWLYIAQAGADSIGVIEVSTGHIQGRIKLQFGDEPIELGLSKDGRTLISTNSGSNTVSIIDTEALIETGRIYLQSTATSVVIGVASPLAYVLHAESNSLSVVDLSRGVLSATVSLDEAPLRGAVSPDGKTLYLITSFSPNLLLLDTQSLLQSGKIFIGRGATSIRSNDNTGLVYIAKRSGEIAVVDPSTLIFIDSFIVRGSAEYLDIDQDEKSLFVLIPERNVLQKLDLFSKKILGTIEVEKGGHTITVMSEK